MSLMVSPLIKATRIFVTDYKWHSKRFKAMEFPMKSTTSGLERFYQLILLILQALQRQMPPITLLTMKEQVGKINDRIITTILVIIIRRVFKYVNREYYLIIL